MKRLAVLVSCLLFVGCGSDIVTCNDNARCLRAGVRGSCVTSPISAARFCIFADPSCSTGQRWDKTAGDGLARQCVGGGPDSADMSLVEPQPNGSPCGSSGGCQSGFCVDGVCCDRDCSGDACTACNVPGSEGTCTAVPNGGAPAPNHPSCGPDDKSTCKRDGTCDGHGACRLWQGGTQCAASSCDSGTNKFTAAATCDGAGTCVVPNAITCAPYLCKDAQNCYAQCSTTSGQCSGTNTCNNGSCGPKTNGAVCGANGECASGHCAQGVCCDSACTGTCMGCNVGTNRGTCIAVPQGQPDPQGGCPAGTGANAACAPGGCNGSGACTVGGPTTVCRPASCDPNLNQATATAYCNGATCPAAATTPCSPYKCGATACTGSCSGDGDCTSTYYCKAPNCVAKLGGQASCTADDQCLSGICTPQLCQCGTAGCAACSASSCTSGGKVCCDGSTLPPPGTSGWCKGCYNGHVGDSSAQGCCSV
jgi:hypothetical protein